MQEIQSNGETATVLIKAEPATMKRDSDPITMQPNTTPHTSAAMNVLDVPIQDPAFIGVEGGKLKIIKTPLENAMMNEQGVKAITREQLAEGLVALKIDNGYLPDFAATIGDNNRYREVAPLFPPNEGEKDFISLELADKPGTYLRHTSYNVINGPKNTNDVDNVFKQDSTWQFHSVNQGATNR